MIAPQPSFIHPYPEIRLGLADVRGVLHTNNALKRLFIIIMATKSINKIHAASFRAPNTQSCRTRMLEQPCEVSPSALESSSSEINHHSSMHNDE